MSNASQILKDIKQELSSEFLEGSITVRGKEYHMRLLNDREQGWSFSQIKLGGQLGLAIEVRRANLAIGVRSIDGFTIEEMFKEMWEGLPEKEQFELLDQEGELEFVYAGMFLEYLKALPSDYIGEIHEGWEKLEKRRKEAQENLKKSLEGASEEDLETKQS